MSQGVTYLHSHSGIERNVRELVNDKFHVLIDVEFKHMFDDCTKDVHPYAYKGKMYYRVPAYAFYMKGGIFKNLNT